MAQLIEQRDQVDAKNWKKMMTNQITDFYPLEFLKWIEIADDDKNAEVVAKMFPKDISIQEALGFWNLRQRAVKELNHHAFTDMVRAATSFSNQEDAIVFEAKKRKVAVDEVRIAY